MTVTLSGKALRIAGRFEEATDATVKDCIVDDEHDQVVILVKFGEMARAIGSGGERIQQLESELGTKIKLVENADRAEDLVANALAPAAVYGVTLSENDETHAYAEVAEDDRGAAIGTGGRNIAAARQLAQRHFDVDDVQLT